MTIPVETFMVKQLVSSAFAADKPALHAYFRFELDHRLTALGYEVMPDTFQVSVHSRLTHEGRPILTADEESAGMTGDEQMAVAEVRCYRIPT